MRAEEIERRLRKYLERDRTGVRKSLIKLLIEGRKYTTGEIHEMLKDQGFELNPRGVSAMVGLMSARLGILKVEMGEKNRYCLKSEYLDLVKNVLMEYDSKNL
ncbi:DUF2551 domain-containing protein [Geoglobus acetivorans]|uniref:DUF2551 domain-containing protein n=1 Tax=Geoglobus acetivorans TaxID=565033 RepID=A0ABZ3H2Q1_GEOAI|nr:DUF2551 domain-containing protein [Geoglobus acetivorans]